MARLTGLEPATSGVTGRHSNQLSYNRFIKISVIESSIRYFILLFQLKNFVNSKWNNFLILKKALLFVQDCKTLAFLQTYFCLSNF